MDGYNEVDYNENDSYNEDDVKGAIKQRLVIGM